MITKKTVAGKTVSAIRNEKFMHGVSIRSIRRAGIDIPVMAQTTVDAGDVVEVVGTRQEVETAARRLGYIDRPTNQTDMIFVGLGILVGGLFGALSVHIGGVPISLSTSGGALIAGLLFGWLRSNIHFRTHSRTVAMGTEQCRAEHVYRRSRHIGRPRFCTGISRCGYQPVPRRRSSHHFPTDYRAVACQVSVQVSSGHRIGMLCGRKDHYGSPRSHTGCRRE